MPVRRHLINPSSAFKQPSWVSSQANSSSLCPLPLSITKATTAVHSFLSSDLHGLKPPHQFNFHLLPKITAVTSSGSTQFTTTSTHHTASTQTTNPSDFDPPPPPSSPCSSVAVITTRAHPCASAPPHHRAAPLLLCPAAAGSAKEKVRDEERKEG
ncbi:hypothetical protein M0R45_016401 [Rubus argutus]|uniref:Uncharacterized protein n=1 Tax=Rubus argutus TaxID=59490 RepID=A0AAW1XSZ5_RUBAR